jgi:hypothetical protein
MFPADRFVPWVAAGAVLAAVALHPIPAAAQPTRFEITIDPSVASAAVTGRLVVVVSKNAQPEPRLAISPQGPAIFGIDLDQLRPGQPIVVDDKAIGYPGPIGRLPPGEYTAQAVINVYEQVRRADGHTIWVHMNDGTQEFFSNAAGNLYSEPQPVRLAPGATVRLTVSKRIAGAPRAADTEWVKRVRLQSRKLTEFWGRPVFLHATVLLPRGYADHPAVRFRACTR